MARISSTAAAAAGTGGARRRAVKKKAVAAAAAVLPEHPAAVVAPSRLQRWLEQARALGLLEPQELVFELHVRQGLPLLVVAQVLSLSLPVVRSLWELNRVERAARAPQSEAEFVMLREDLSARLWQTVEATYPGVPLLGAGADAEVAAEEEQPGPTAPPMLSVRLKALDQISKLYDVGVTQTATSTGPLPYATPEEIAEDVRLRLLEMHRRE